MYNLQSLDCTLCTVYTVLYSTDVHWTPLPYFVFICSILHCSAQLYSALLSAATIWITAWTFHSIELQLDGLQQSLIQEGLQSGAEIASRQVQQEMETWADMVYLEKSRQKLPALSCQAIFSHFQQFHSFPAMFGHLIHLNHLKQFPAIFSQSQPFPYVDHMCP